MLLSESEMDSVMRAFDHNRNGKVDFLEFYGQLARHRPARDAAPLRAVAPAPLSPRRPEVAARCDALKKGDPSASFMSRCDVLRMKYA